METWKFKTERHLIWSRITPIHGRYEEELFSMEPPTEGLQPIEFM